MRKRLVWSERQDEELRRRRRAGEAWDGIALALGLSRNAVTERGRHIGARMRRPPPPSPAAAVDPDRAPLPAGHPASWDALVAGTVLEGLPYPWPVFDLPSRRRR